MHRLNGIYTNMHEHSATERGRRYRCLFAYIRSESVVLPFLTVVIIEVDLLMP